METIFVMGTRNALHGNLIATGGYLGCGQRKVNSEGSHFC